MATQYLDIVNKVLKRLREPQVSTVNENDYSALIGEFVNDAKREVEDSWNWSALRTTLTVTTQANVFNYTLVGSGARMRILSVNDDTNDIEITYNTAKWFDTIYQNSNVVADKPIYYNLNGVSSAGDMQMDLYPPPNGVYALRVNAVVPEATLVNNTDETSLPSELIIAGAMSRAVEERGLDGGNQTAELRFRLMLADYIAIDSGNREDEIIWGAV